MKRMYALKWPMLWALFLFVPFWASAQGSFQRAVRFLGDEDHLDQAAFLDSSQTVVGLGIATDGDNMQLLVSADLQGHVLWQRVIPDTATNFLSMEHLCTVGNSIIVGGDASGDSTYSGIAKFDAQGNIQWYRTFSWQPNVVTVEALAAEGEDFVVFGGQAHDGIPFSANAMVGKLWESTGAVHWISTFDDSLEFHVQTVASTPSGEVVAAGDADNWPNQTVHFSWIAKWSNQGTLLWCKRLDFQGYLQTMLADSSWIYLAGSEVASSPLEHLMIMQLTQSGDLHRLKSLSNPDQESYAYDIKMDGTRLNVVAGYTDWNTGNEYSLLMGLDSTLSPNFAWLDVFGQPYALAGTDASGLLHFVGSYQGDPNFDQSILLGAVPNAPISSIPCGMEIYAPTLTDYAPALIDYPVTAAGIPAIGTRTLSARPLPLIPLADCSESLGLPEGRFSVQIGPNPTQDRVNIHYPDAEFNVQLLGLDGKVLLPAQGYDSMDLDLTSFAAGIYLLQVESGGQITTQRISKL